MIPLSRGVKASVLDRGLSTLMCKCDVDPMAALLVFARVREIGCSESEAVGWLLYDLALAMIAAVAEWNGDG